MCWTWFLRQIETRTLEEVQEVLHSVAQGKGRVTRVMLDNMVVPLENGDVDVSLLQQAVSMIEGKFETEVCVHFIPYRL